MHQLEILELYVTSTFPAGHKRKLIHNQIHIKGKKEQMTNTCLSIPNSST